MASKVPVIKNHPRPRGLQSVGHSPGADINFNKMNCGYIQRDPYWEKTSLYRIRLKVVAPVETHATGWKWIQLKATFEELDQAKEFVKTRWADIQKAYALHFTPLNG